MTNDFADGRRDATGPVLLLDDDKLALEELSEILELEDIDAVTACSVADAVSVLECDPSIALVVSDVHIVNADGSTSNGISFARDARERFAGRDLAFIILSGDASAVTDSVNTGIVEFLTKPVIPDELVSTIHDRLSKRAVPATAAPRPDDLTEKLVRQLEQKTNQLQRVSSDLADRETEIGVTRAQQDRLRLQAQRIRRAIASGHICPWFQPQIASQTGNVTGFEALVRWIDPEQGVLSPAEFLPMAEEAGMMIELDAHIQRCALQGLRDIRNATGTDLNVGLNLTAEQLADPECVDKLALEVECAGLTPPDIHVEILETSMLDSPAAAPIRDTIMALDARGFCIELDDFGTGHAALSSLRDLPVERLKIDRSFVRSVHEDAKLQKFTRALIGLAKALDIQVLAEGAECAAEMDWLREAGCDAVQGFHIAKPMPIQDACTFAINALTQDTDSTAFLATGI